MDTQHAETESPRPRMSADEMIDKYVKIRDRKKELEDKHAAELAPYNEALTRLGAWLLEALDQAGLKSMNSKHGVAYKSLRTSARVTDWAATLTFIQERQAWDLLERRVSKLAVQSYVEEMEAPVPGVETTSEQCVNVRRANGGASS